MNPPPDGPPPDLAPMERQVLDVFVDDVREADGTEATERSTYYEPAVELKRLVGGFIREQIRPHIENPDHRKLLCGRIDRIDNWMRSGSRALPLLQKILGQ